MKVKAIIIDDSEVVRNQIKECLESIDNIDVIGEAEDGFKGLEMILALDPTLIILDQQMPKMTGGELLSKLKKYAIEIDTIVSSENVANMEDQYERMKDLGVADVIVKPIDNTVLKRLVIKCLEFSSRND